jgi:hypothetical protein
LLSEMLEYHTNKYWPALIRSAISFSMNTECNKDSKSDMKVQEFIKKWYYIQALSDPDPKFSRERETNFTHNILPRLECGHTEIVDPIRRIYVIELQNYCQREFEVGL